MGDFAIEILGKVSSGSGDELVKRVRLIGFHIDGSCKNKELWRKAQKVLCGFD